MAKEIQLLNVSVPGYFPDQTLLTEKLVMDLVTDWFGLSENQYALEVELTPYYEMNDTHIFASMYFPDDVVAAEFILNNGAELSDTSSKKFSTQFTNVFFYNVGENEYD